MKTQIRNFTDAATAGRRYPLLAAPNGTSSRSISQEGSSSSTLHADNLHFRASLPRKSTSREVIAMDTARLITITLNTLHCHREEQSGGSNPYLWPAMVFLNKRTAQVGLVSIFESSAHKIVKAGMKTGDTAAIDPQVGTMSRHFQEPIEG